MENTNLCKYGVDHSTMTMCKYCDADQVAAASKPQANDHVVPSLVDQPKPKFTIEDLETKLSFVYNMTMGALKSPQEAAILLKQANGTIQELVSIVAKHRADLEPIDINKPEVALVLEVLKTEEVAFNVVGVQLIENGVLKGTSLYSTVVKARKIKDQLNREFARLRVNHEAKILNYPVY